MAICDISLPIIEICSLSYVQGGYQQCTRLRNNKKINIDASLVLTAIAASPLQSAISNKISCVTDKKIWKRVRFSDLHIPPASSRLTPPVEINLLNKMEIWYQASDYRYFRNGVRRGIASEKYPVSGHVTGGKVSYIPTLYTRNLQQIYAAAASDDLNNPRITYSKRIVASALKMEPSKRGYETHLMDGVRKASKNYVSFIVEKQLFINNDPDLNDEMKIEALRWFSKRRTRTSRRFAKAMGELDAAAVAGNSMCA